MTTETIAAHGEDICFAATRPERYCMSRIADSVRGRLGSPVLDWATVLRLSLDITRRVVEAGELNRFRDAPLTAADVYDEAMSRGASGAVAGADSSGLCIRATCGAATSGMSLWPRP